MIPYLILGIIQGLTEFFPVSSSAHLAVFQRLFGLQKEAVAISVVLHLGTACALVLFFFREIRAALKCRRTLMLIAATTLFTGIIGLSGRKFFEQLFTNLGAVACALMVTGIIMVMTVRFGKGGRRTNLTVRDALILGLTQGFAIIPGISRSGITIATLLSRGIEAPVAFSFSFIAAVPVIFGAALLEAGDIGGVVAAHPGEVSAGFMASFVFGLIALAILKTATRRARLHYFGFYCFAAAILILVFVK